MQKPLRVATVGTGYFSQFHYNAWQQLSEDGDITLAAICNRSRAGAEEFAKRYSIPEIFTDFDAMLDQINPDLVDIITPPVTHSAYVGAAIEKGIPVICQKPFTSSLQEAEALVRSIEDKQATVIIHENFRFQPWYSKLKELLEQGVIGMAYQVSFRLRPGDGQGPEAYLNRQPYFQQMERLLVHETAIHLIDTFRYLFGEITAVFAQLVKLNPVIKGEDAGIILFDFANGRRGLFDGNRLVDHKAENRRLTMGEMSIEGSNGTLRLDGDGGIQLRRHDDNYWQPIPYEWHNRDYAGDCVYRTQKHVVDHLLIGSPVMNTAKEYLTNLRIEEAVYQSSATGKKIAIANT
ncbi:MAG: Gfo/Idh/MocA family oxidoreductase [Candidatus Competibacteraceae bacterium]|jgi:predicted dehydrogenase|nr:Gfo/Idh/MocA family oxidoreductase [Candidatus Competibacteraceae bacterium]